MYPSHSFNMTTPATTVATRGLQSPDLRSRGLLSIVGGHAAQNITMAAPPAPQEDLPRDISCRFGKRLRQLREWHGKTQVQLSIELGIDRSFISDMERGRKSVSLPILHVIALGFHLSLSDLLKGI